MKDSELLQTDDAMIWAKEFVESMKRNQWTLEDIDEGLMVGWFANAMMAKYDIMMRRFAEKTEMPTLEELKRDGISVRLPTVEEIADNFIVKPEVYADMKDLHGFSKEETDNHIKEMMNKEKGLE